MKLLSERDLNMWLPAHARSCPTEHGLHCVSLHMLVKRGMWEREQATHVCLTVAFFFTSLNLLKYPEMLFCCILFIAALECSMLSLTMSNSRSACPSLIHTHFHFAGWWGFNQQQLRVTYLLYSLALS